MRKDTGQVFRLEDYRPSDYLIASTELDFDLRPTATTVRARLDVRRREGAPIDAPLVLDGDGLDLLELLVEGKPPAAGSYEVTPDSLAMSAPPMADRFIVEMTIRLDPTGNGALMGLYLSSGVYCTQCEAEGFRRIIYFLDRPDILSVYTVRMSASRAEAPLLLSNGNPVEQGDLPDGRHYAVWHDPHPKPSYLFALVAGDLGAVRDRFVTASGRPVDLAIHVEHGKEHRAAYAMDALKRSMRWDEEVYGLEYDLDVFNIVAVSDFNMGAMENKGLNIFNDKYVLADEETATDADFANIEAIIAHEYFHNWTGNRITCRDWFQLCLKEGLTVFRDHEFSADMRSRAVKRISEVRALRAHQFPEDQGPLAHPVRPRRYREINNFYTATVYEKGSEVVRMIRTILGAEAFRAGMQLYIERHDGDAATIEDFLQAFEEASGRDLSQFALWYHQAGTPNVSVNARHDAGSRELRIEIEQSVPATPSESRKRLMHIPLAFGLVGPDGRDMEFGAVEGAEVADGVIHLRKRRHEIRIGGIAERPVLSINRGFSAPVTLAMERRRDDLVFLARYDSDAFARWEALNALFTAALIDAYGSVRSQARPVFDDALLSIVPELAADEALEPAFRALALALPSETDIAREIGTGIDPDAILTARQALQRAIGRHGESTFAALHESLAERGQFNPDAAGAGRRALRNVALEYRVAAGADASPAMGQYRSATNMTDRAAALAVLVHLCGDMSEAVEALDAFEKRYGGDPLVMDKWLMVQATAPGHRTVESVRALMDHRGFSLANPNRVRALLGSFASANQTAFHRPDGAGYRLFADTVLRIDRGNPQLAARLATAFRSWKSLEPVRQDAARRVMLALAGETDLSTDLRDILERTLA
jgi:aminopeptidase N